MKKFVKGRFVLLSLLSVFGYLIFVQEVTLAQKQEGAQITKQPTQVDLTFVKEVSLAGNRDAKLTFFHSKEAENPVPKIEVYEKRIVFYDGNGNKISERGYDTKISVHPSNNKKFLQVTRAIRTATISKDGEIVVEFLTDKDELLWSTRVRTTYDYGLYSFNISNAGTVVGIKSMAGDLIFYSKTGSELREVSVFENPYVETEIGYKPSFSPDGKFFAVATTPPRYHRQKSEVILFTSEGQELLRLPTQHMAASRLIFSDDSKYLVSCHYTYNSEGISNTDTYVFDVDTGSVISSHENMSIDSVMFFHIDSEDYILVVYNVGKKVALINIQTRKIIPIYSVESQLGIVDINVSKENNLIGIIADAFSRPSMSAPYIVLLDLNEREVGRVSIPTQHTIEYGSAHLNFLNGGKKMMVELDREKKALFFNLDMH